MLLDPEERTIVSSKGWVDGGALWVMDVSTGVVRAARVGDARYLVLRHGRSGYFTVSHNYESSRHAITVHRFSQPDVVLARYDLLGERGRLEGDTDLWPLAPRHFVAHLIGPEGADFRLVTMDLESGPTAQRFDWFSDQFYDRSWQGITEVVEIPGTDLVLVSVQRSSALVIYDPAERKKRGEVRLPNQPGASDLYFRRTAGDFWACNYDTLMKIEPHSWKVLMRRKLQHVEPGENTAAKFVGSVAFNADETICVVPRPFSGDVIGLDPNSFRIRFRAVLGMQPLEAVVLRNGRVFARDWQTGTLLEGEFLPFEDG